MLTFEIDSKTYMADIKSLIRIGSGAVGDVFQTKNNNQQEVAIKIYRNPDQIDWYRIENLLYKSKSVNEGYAGVSRFAFPRAIVFDGQKKVGIILPLFSGRYYISLDNWTEVGLRNALDGRIDNCTFNLKVIIELAKLIKVAHINKISIVDLKPSNILVNTRDGSIAILDTDSFGFFNNSQKKFLPTHVSADYIDPVNFSDKLDIGSLWHEQDLYAFSVITFQIMNFGLHPYQCIIKSSSDIPETNDDKARKFLYPYGLKSRIDIFPSKLSIHESWPKKIRETFDLAFEKNRTRPSIDEWIKLFDDIIENKELERCDKFPNDPKHIKFYNMECGRCKIDNNRSGINNNIESSAKLYSDNITINLEKKGTPNSDHEYLVKFAVMITIFFLITLISMIKLIDNDGKKSADLTKVGDYSICNIALNSERINWDNGINGRHHTVEANRRGFTLERCREIVCKHEERMGINNVECSRLSGKIDNRNSLAEERNAIHARSLGKVELCKIAMHKALTVWSYDSRGDSIPYIREATSRGLTEKECKLAICSDESRLGVSSERCCNDYESKNDPDIIYYLQKRLKDLNYDPGMIDGILGPKTRQAIRLYQRSRREYESGEVSCKLLRDIGVYF